VSLTSRVVIHPRPHDRAGDGQSGADRFARDATHRGVREHLVPVLHSWPVLLIPLIVTRLVVFPQIPGS
jgi:hypothetical protein